jgi:hypothetical protein
LAAAYLANAIKWNGGSTIAAITPVLKGGFAYAIVNRASTMACDKAKKGPHAFLWENSDAEEAAAMVRSLTLPWSAALGDLIAALGTVQQSGPMPGRSNGLVRKAALLERRRSSAMKSKALLDVRWSCAASTVAERINGSWR